MKALIFAASLGIGSIAAMAATDLSSELNVVLKQILASYENQNTQANLAFSQADIEGDHALSAEIHGQFQKTGPNNHLLLKLDTLRYAANSLAAPATAAKASLQFDVLKLVDQATINDIIPDLPAVVASIVADQAGDLKDALVVTTTVGQTFQNTKGDYQEVKGKIDLRVDFTKLPKHLPAEEVPITGGMIEFDFVVSKGIALDALFYSNLNYKGFQAGQLGLKEIFERLVGRDREADDLIHSYLGKINDYAKQITGSEI